MDKNDICKTILKVKGHHLVDDKEIEIGVKLIKNTHSNILSFLEERWNEQDNNTNLKEKALVLSLQKFIINEEEDFKQT